MALASSGVACGVTVPDAGGVDARALEIAGISLDIAGSALAICGNALPTAGIALAMEDGLMLQANWANASANKTNINLP
jgi:hypothetical protein